MARSPRAKVMSTRGLTCVCPTPSSSYSIGSSTVRMLRSWPFSAERMAYSVVLLPEPVGPVTRMIPCGRSISPFSFSSSSSISPSLLMSGLRLLLSSRRITTRSPYWDGMVDTRTSIALRPMRREIRPSWGRRFSAMSSFDITLIRDTSSGASLRAGCSTGRSTPSTRSECSGCARRFRYEYPTRRPSPPRREWR